MTKNPKIPLKPYKDLQFQEFLKLLEGEAVEHWIEIAEALDVDKDTINSWKDHPEAMEARRKGIKRALEGMEKAGHKDWKMWKAKLALLKIQEVEKSDVTSGGEKIAFPILGGKSDEIHRDDSNKEDTPTN